MFKNQIQRSKFPKGSEWRRWDLHIHTPESKLGDSFTGVDWNDYVDSLDEAAKEHQIAVIGITDYLTIDGYEKLKRTIEEPTNKKLNTVDLILPNIEFRCAPATAGKHAFNIHILVDPSDKDHVRKIKKALGNLQFKYQEQKYSCTRDDLIEFGRAQNSGLNDELAYQHGIRQFKPSVEVLLAWLRDETWLRENSLLVVPNGKDGSSGLPPDSFGAVRDNILREADLIFSANPNDRLYYLGKKSGVPESEIVRMYGSLKPCIHGSDAHEISKLFEPDKERYCWIKADPTFEGLRQVCWEPDLRVSIGQTKPQHTDNSRVIKEIDLSGCDNWFSDTQIPINPGLVVVIGEKGSGKTAIADMLAFASGVAVDDKSQSSFIVKAKKYLEGRDVSINWLSGSNTKGTLTQSPFESASPLVRYLSQDFVERLCSIDHGGKELALAIEEVVFSHLDEVQREDYSSFEELKLARQHATQMKQDDIRGKIVSLNREIGRLRSLVEDEPNKHALIRQLEQQLVEMKAQLPDIEKSMDSGVLKKLNEKQELFRKLQADVSKKRKRVRSLKEFLSFYAELREQTNERIHELAKSISDIEELPQNIIDGLVPIWPTEGVESIYKSVADIEKTILAITGDEADVVTTPEATLKSTIEDLESLKQQLSVDETNKKRLLDLQQQISNTETKLRQLKREVEQIRSSVTPSLEKQKSDRLELYVKYFDSISENIDGLSELYEPMKLQLESLEGDQKFELKAGVKISLDSWLTKIRRYCDGRKLGSSEKLEEIEKFAKTTLADAWKSLELDEVKKAMESFEKLVEANTFISKFGSPSMTYDDLVDWMYSTDHITTTYEIRYGGIELESLSPGTRGIALLVLYLIMDTDDKRPLIIDQPEGNLDNSSVYDQLVPFIKEAKKQRQIILVTHNPNLVVSTDAEQVIVAVPERRSSSRVPIIEYFSGSLEHTSNKSDSEILGTRELVCRFLEGGSAAFKSRESRYSLKT